MCACAGSQDCGAGKCEICRARARLEIEVRVDIVVLSPNSTGQARQAGNRPDFRVVILRQNCFSSVKLSALQVSS